MTVVFVDCAGSPELSTRLDPEDLHAVMDGCFQHLMDAVHRYEGTVNQFTGDGIMALFGAPIATRIRGAGGGSGLAHQEVGAAVRGHPARHARDQLAVRIGINTGPVVVGKIGDDLRMDYGAGRDGEPRRPPAAGRSARRHAPQAKPPCAW